MILIEVICRCVLAAFNALCLLCCILITTLYYVAFTIYVVFTIYTIVKLYIEIELIRHPKLTINNTGYDMHETKDTWMLL